MRYRTIVKLGVAILPINIGDIVVAEVDPLTGAMLLRPYDGIRKKTKKKKKKK